MLFTRLGHVVAYFTVALGICWIAGGLIIATGLIDVLRYFGSKPSAGAFIGHGIYIVVFGLALGVLTEISYAVQARY